MSTDITLGIGILGGFLMLLAFTLNELKVWNVEELRYDVVNLIGAFFLSLYSYLIGSVPFLILNLVWLFVSTRDVIKDLKS